jgi:hypothetical protein
MKLTASAASEAVAAALAVDVARLQLSGLTSLSMELNRAWSDTEGASYFWAALGRITQMQTLTVAFSARSPNFEASQLSALGSLGDSLQQLQISCPAFTAADRQQDYSALSSLRGLTDLTLPYAAGTAGLHAILSSCSRLQRLHFRASSARSGAAAAAAPALGEAECASLGQMTQLTFLGLVNIACSPELLPALQQLRQLRVLHVDGLSAATALPALAKLTQLSYLVGKWQESAAAAAAGAVVQLTALAKLSTAGQGIPFHAFPNALTVLYYSTLEPGQLLSLSQHCKQLRALHMIGKWPANASTLDPAAAAADRVAAMDSLAVLPHLRSLSITVNCDAEISALAAVSQLQQLTLFVTLTNRRTNSCSALGLATLGLLRQLRLLDLQLSGLKLSAAAVCGLLSSMQYIELVKLCVAAGQGGEAASGVALAASRLLKGPGEVTVAVNDKWPAFGA